MMECNKEEAIRAKEIAETKMQNKDFSGARKVALKAQQLYPELENISQLLMVCDVHLSADSKSYGNGKDWYDVLKVESTADEILIKKQYRKFALALHPDKNKFAGATDAFKLIGEAQRVLLDREKRSLYDSKLKNWRPNRGPTQQQARNNPNSRTQPWAQNPFMGKTTSPFTSFNPQQQQPQMPPQATFWTMCPYCTVKYQYYRDVVNKVLRCQRCTKSFTGHEIKNHVASIHTPWTQPNSRFMPQTREAVAKTGTSEVGRDSKAKSKSSAKVNVKRKRRIDDESSESCDSGSSSESEEDVIQENGDVKVKQDFGCFRENLRRSTRSRTNISYEEKLSDDDDLGSFSKKGKSSGSFRANKDLESENKPPAKNKFQSSSKSMEEDDSGKVKSNEDENINEGLSAMKNAEKKSVNANCGISPDSSPDKASAPEIYDYPDPEFNDFGKDRREDCFAVGQIWAVYDTLDAMPRFYARINRILSTSVLKLRITYLDPDPDDEDEIKWVEAGLPVSCGELTKGNTETTDKRLMFSHLVDWKKGSKKDTYKIYPRKGETWALFRNWDMTWHSDPETKTKYEFEFVEILSNYCENDGVHVAYLGKVKGFSCLFSRITMGGVDSFPIPRSQLFRFSHRVPSFHLSGEEREGVPNNSFELDPASLPSKVEEIDIPKDLKAGVETVVVSKGNSPKGDLENEMELNTEKNCNLSEENPEVYEIPEPEFFNFAGEKSPEKFRTGQFWALYSDENGLPKCYAFIRKIVHQPEFKLHVTWLSPLTKNTIKNADERMIPIGCGIFRHSRGKTSSYSNTKTFSHCLRVEPTDKRNEFAIYPRKGEVWAVYKNWNSRMTSSDMKKSEYNTVEILEENDFAIKVLVLERVIGYKSVFKAQRMNGTRVVDQIIRSQLLKFSHQIPAFQLTGEREGSLKGFWELDPAALPIKTLRSS